VANPSALADALYLDGDPLAAAGYYHEALQRESDAADKAWLLFQSANCQLSRDLSAAAKTYGRLLSECSDCPWSPAATLLKKLAEWRVANEVSKVLSDVGSSAGP